MNICDDINRLLDIIITIYYTDEVFLEKYHNMSILWNSFSDEMIKRAQGNHQVGKINKQAWQDKKEKSKQAIQKRKEYADAHTPCFNAEVFDSDINQIKKATDNIEAQRLSLLVHIMCSSQVLGDEQTGQIKLRPKGRKNNSISRLAKLVKIDRRKCNSLFSYLENCGVITQAETDDNAKIVKCLIESQQGNKVARIKNPAEFNQILEKYFQK